MAVGNNGCRDTASLLYMCGWPEPDSGTVAPYHCFPCQVSQLVIFWPWCVAVRRSTAVSVWKHFYRGHLLEHLKHNPIALSVRAMIHGEHLYFRLAPRTSAQAAKPFIWSTP